jgi:hypothetical protein
MRLARRWASPLAYALALAAGASSLTYRFGRDQAIFFYLGRGWLDGQLPYRDAFDLKPPGLYAAHALAIAVVGQNEVAARVLDLGGVLLAGALALRVVRRHAVVPGALGLGALLLASWHYGNLDFWQTAQAEVWVALFALAGLAALGEGPGWTPRRAALAGCLAGLGPTFKLTGVILGVPVALLLLVRAWRGPAVAAPGGADGAGGGSARRLRRSAIALGVFTLAAATPTAVFALGLTLAGGGEALVDAVGYLRRYAGQGNWFVAEERMVGFFLRRGLPWHLPFVGLWALGLVDAIRQGERDRVGNALLAVGLFATAFATVVLQQKFFDYHWGVTGPFLVMMAAGGLVTLARQLRPALAFFGAVALAALGLALAPPWNANPNVDWMSYQGAVLRRMAGDLSERDFLRRFVAEARYDYLSHRELADAIATRGGGPGDGLHVRGFELTVYALTGMRSPSRFVSELPLDNPAWAYQRSVWRAEHAEALADDPPRFFVTFVDRPGDIRQLEARGYRPVTRAGMLLLLERGPSGAAPASGPGS